MASTFGRRFLPLLARRSVLHLHPIRFPFSSVPAFSNEIIKKQNLAAEKFKKAIEQKMGKIAVDTSDIILPNYACPFDIKETPGKYIFILERKYVDETIQVEVQTTSHKSLYFNVSITKPDDNNPKAFDCYGCDPAYENFWPKFDRDGLEGATDYNIYGRPGLEAFDYLKERGIDKEFVSFLKAYKDKKYDREHLTVLKEITNFIEK